MKYVSKTLNGITHIGISGAIVLGFVFVFDMLFSPESTALTRILLALLALVAFLNGFISEGGGESGGKDDEEGAA